MSMFAKIIRASLTKCGYTIQKTRSLKQAGAFTLHEFIKPDGSFDYERYRNVQTEGNRRHLKSVWVNEGNIRFLSEYIRALLGVPSFGICHGSRQGKEQEWFSKY